MNLLICLRVRVCVRHRVEVGRKLVRPGLHDLCLCVRVRVFVCVCVFVCLCACLCVYERVSV